MNQSQFSLKLGRLVAMVILTLSAGGAYAEVDYVPSQPEDQCEAVLAPRKPWRLSGLAAMAFATMPYSSDANQSTHMDLNFSDSGNVQLIAGERGKKKEKGDDEEEPMQAAWCTTNSSNRYSFETEILVVPSGTTLQNLFPLIRTAMVNNYRTAAVPPGNCQIARTEQELRLLQKKRANWEMLEVKRTGRVQVIDPRELPGKPYQFIKPETNPTLGQESAPKALGVSQGLNSKGFGEPGFGRQGGSGHQR